jgi:bifunctional DNA-binding transcriptional regulator/antitoxin component of YhaV-PrlF toxin-antitoxin module
MAKKTENLPQVVVIADLKREGGLYLRKSVRESLGVPKDGVVRCFERDGEIWLTAQAHKGAPLALEGRGRVTLPDDVLTALRVADGEPVALIERPEGLALKRVAIEQVPASAC